jgi:superfamily II RNA helicase
MTEHTVHMDPNAHEEMQEDMTTTATATATAPATMGPIVSSRSHFALVTNLRAKGALPAILFNYDRKLCERIACQILAPWKKRK